MPGESALGLTFRREIQANSQKTKEMLNGEYWMKNDCVAVVGATGAVGSEMIRILEERQFPIGKLTLLASERSVGKELSFRGQPLPVSVLTENSYQGGEIGLFSPGGSVSGINKWVVADSIQKGAALNAVQSAETLIQKYL
jgi:aspartate-semialdehyde dehydrogenase